MAADTDVWHWRFYYADGTQFNEFDEDGTDHGFAEVDLAQVVALELVPQRPNLPNHIVLITPQEQRPIFFRRRAKPLLLSADAVQVTGHLTVTVIGWQETVQGQNVTHYSAFFDDGSSFATTDHDTLIARINLIAAISPTSSSHSSTA